jgi:hypothetical protein
MRLAGQFKRLNKLAGVAGVGARCAYCQFALRENWESSSAKKAKPNPDKVRVTCEWCGTQYTATLPADPIERAARLEILHDTVAESYATHRKRALHIWLGYHARALLPKPKAKERPRNNTPQTPAQKRRKEMLDALYKHISDAHRRARRAAPKFPDLDEILFALLPGHYSSDETSDYGRESYFEHRTKQLDALAKLETILWNEPRPETLAARQAHQEAIKERIERKTKEAKEREEKQERERLERQQRRKDMLERTRPSSAVRFRVTDPIDQPAPTDKSQEDDFWKRELSSPPVVIFQDDLIDTQLASHAPDPNPLVHRFPPMRVNR